MQWTPEIRCTGPCLPAAPLKALPMSIALPLPSALAEALAQRGYDALTQVQSAVLADGLAGKDLLVSAQTGSGKTVAFGLAMAADLLAGAETLERADTPLAVIVAPVAVPSCSKPPLPPRLPTAPFSAGTPPRVRFVVHLDTHGAELVTHAI